LITVVFRIGGESLMVAQNTYAVSWFHGRELNMVFGLQLSFSRVVHNLFVFLHSVEEFQIVMVRFLSVRIFSRCIFLYPVITFIRWHKILCLKSGDLVNWFKELRKNMDIGQITTSDNAKSQDDSSALLHLFFYFMLRSLMVVVTILSCWDVLLNDSSVIITGFCVINVHLVIS